jgi:aspartate racemase
VRTIGILGGMSAASTQVYYRELCQLTRARLGGLHSPELLIRSLDFAKVEALQVKGEWAAAGDILNNEAKALERGGAQLIILATNTMHKLADQMMAGVNASFIHIADATAKAINEKGLRRPGLMATAFTLQHPFYTERLIAAGLTPVLPDAADQAETHRIIFQELCKDIRSAESGATFIAIANRLADAGADSLILGCTEVGMLLNQGNVAKPLFDTTLIHCAAALEWAVR